MSISKRTKSFKTNSFIFLFSCTLNPPLVFFLKMKFGISGRHRKHSLWLLTQSHTAISKNLRRQKKQLFVWHPSEKSDLRMIDEETNLMTSDDVSKIKGQLKSEKHACLYLQLEHPRTFQVLSNNKHGSYQTEKPGSRCSGEENH